jgi:drug/metabolite transporter (DMT)-like permease
VFVTLALASAAFYGAADFLGGLASKRVDTIVVAFVAQLAGLILLAIIVPVRPRASPERADYLWGAGAGVAGATGVALLYHALSIGTMSIVVPTTAVCAVAVPVLAAFVLGERVGPLAAGGIVLAIPAIALISRSETTDADRTRPSGLGLAFLSGVAIGLFFLGLAQASHDAGLWPLIAGRSVSVPLLGAIVLIRRPALTLGSGASRIAVGCGTLDMLANALYLIATNAGPLSLVATLASLYPASTVLLARFTLGERLTRAQALGVVCALVAVVLMVGSS